MAQENIFQIQKYSINHSHLYIDNSMPVENTYFTSNDVIEIEQLLT